MSKSSSRPAPATRRIKHFSDPPRKPAKPSGGSTQTSRETIRKAKTPGEINPKQMNH
ncbi:hypothetical protein [Bradyrhizobium sp. McL0616]|uniref:hypothetical protein n=1 Tax=Bradyrhizobium sp. McL0616 TaxID=3415674 RepID=UPI003CEA7AAD